MKCRKYKKYFRWFFLFIETIFLSSCNSALLDPKGQIGLEQRSLMLTVFSLMLIVVVPAILMTIIFAYRYRENNKHMKYCPHWSQSTRVELVIWIIPILIILFLAILTWKTTHLLEPSKPLFSNQESLVIEVVSMDWKWFFIYPNYRIATVNEIAFPVNVPILFKVTSNSVMNSFFIPRLGSQIYAMAGMQTNLYLIANQQGIYDGISSNYSGSGFSGMKFKTIVTPNLIEFCNWVKRVRQSSNKISNMSTFEKIAIPSKNNQVEYFSDVKPNLFQNIINKFNL